MIERFVSRYDLRTPLQESFWESMPAQELHVQTRELLGKHGFEHKHGHSGAFGHTFTHPEKSGIPYAFAQGWDPEGDDPLPHPEGHVAVHDDLPSLGYKRNKKADFDFSHGHHWHSGVVYDHPNGTRLTIRHAEDESESEQEVHADLHLHRDSRP